MDSVFDILPEDSRLTTYPLARPRLFEWYEDAARSYWVPSELFLSNDAYDYRAKLTPSQQHFVKYVLAFFAASDGIINVNIVRRFRQEVPMLEATYFFDFQTMMENTHALTYSLLLQTIIPDEPERAMLLNAVETMPVIAKMSKYMFATADSRAGLPERLLRSACAEGIFFAGCFCVIYWLQSNGLMPGLGQSNELIARDEGLHTMFTLYLYEMVRPEHKLAANAVEVILREAIDVSKEFINSALPEPMPGMNATMMIEYVESLADGISILLGFPVVYGSKNKFHFMDKLNMANKSNFFERRASEYSKAKLIVAPANGDRSDDF